MARTIRVVMGKTHDELLHALNLLRKSYNPVEHDHGHGQELKQAAVMELEDRVAKYLYAHPEVTRQIAVYEVFRADSSLYDRVREETTHDRHGNVLRVIQGNEAVSKSGESIDAEVARRVEQLMAKTAGATRDQAMAFVFREDPALYERWKRESYA